MRGSRPIKILFETDLADGKTFQMAHIASAANLERDLKTMSKKFKKEFNRYLDAYKKLKEQEPNKEVMLVSR